MIRYPVRAARALGYLKRRNNDIEVYLEDTSNRAMWLQALNNILPKHAKLRSVNLLGGRHSVIEACRADQQDDGRRRLYVIDGDFDFLLGKRKPSLKNIYRLSAYCVENLLVHDQSVCSVASDAMVMADLTEISETIAFENEINEIERLLLPLFINYATVFSLDRSIQTVGYSVKSLLTNEGAHKKLDAKKVYSRSFRVLRAGVKSAGFESVKAARTKIEERARRLKVRQCISGKDYILPIFWLNLKTKCGYRGTEDQLKVQLARAVVPNIEKRFASHVKRLMQ